MNVIAKITKAQAARDQAALWNGSAGRAWVAAQTALDQMYAPFDDLLAMGSRPVVFWMSVAAPAAPPWRWRGVTPNASASIRPGR